MTTEFSQLRQNAGISIQECAEHLEITTTIAHLYETGETKPRISELLALKGLNFLPNSMSSSKGKVQIIEEVEVFQATISSEHEVNDLNRTLFSEFSSIIRLDSTLNRKLVSFQANKARSSFRWYKYREGFSASLIERLLSEYSVSLDQKVLDPFAGSGTSLFVASKLGADATGIELLPIGQQIIQSRLVVSKILSESDFRRLSYWATSRPWNLTTEKIPVPNLRITRGAYPQITLDSIEKYQACVVKENANLQLVLRFALLCVLEEISFTRKDGQYLRWDCRSDRTEGSGKFNKGTIRSFDDAIVEKLLQIHSDANEKEDLGLFDKQKIQNVGSIKSISGSCLKILPEIDANCYDMVVTSPPYCNRYDYTRTYALELALLGIDEKQLVELRQTMLSCTVENREKDLIEMCSLWKRPIEVADNQKLLQSILSFLDQKKKDGLLNNTGIPRMVRGYFYEMACVIHELFRILKSGGRVVMVNDNVKYAGIAISVDLILSSIAQSLGFVIESILVLPISKGNSSQQMGEHGRDALRKCVYVWKKPSVE